MRGQTIVLPHSHTIDAVGLHDRGGRALNQPDQRRELLDLEFEQRRAMGERNRQEMTDPPLLAGNKQSRSISSLQHGVGASTC